MLPGSSVEQPRHFCAVATAWLHFVLLPEIIPAQQLLCYRRFQCAFILPQGAWRRALRPWNFCFIINNLLCLVSLLFISVNKIFVTHILTLAIGFTYPMRGNVVGTLCFIRNNRCLHTSPPAAGDEPAPECSRRWETVRSLPQISVPGHVRYLSSFCFS